MVVAQKVKESEITEQDSLLLTRNLLRIAIFNISYIRGLFPEKYFNDKSVPALGVYDALQKKYLKTLLFCVCESADGPMIEEYSFAFSYSNSDSQEVSMNINRSGTKKGGTFKYNSTTEITPSQMRSSACKMVRTLVQLMRTLDKMPEERTVLMKLLYYDDVTVGLLLREPMDYEPPFFRGCTEEEVHNPWTRNALKMEVGKVNSKHLILALKVKSVLDPCEDENNENQDDEVSLGDDSLHKDDYSESDSEISNSDDDQYVVAPIDKQKIQEDNGAIEEDDTQDPAEDEQQLGRLKDWIHSYHLDTIELTDVLSNFPDISVILIEEIMDKLVKEGFISKAGYESYVINKNEKFDYEFDAVKEEVDGQLVANDGQAGNMGADHMYMKALYHTLPMKYISVAKLQNKLEGEASQTTVKKLIDKMTQDGFLETGSNRRLGKRVIHSDLTKTKLIEVKKLFDTDAMDLDMKEAVNKSNHLQNKTTGNKNKDLSTCGGLHSIGSDITRTRGRSDAYLNESTRTENGVGKKREHGNTPTSRAEPAASGESFALGADNGRANGNTNHDDEMDIVMESRQTQDKRFRKASTVKEPILQYTKRQKSQAA
ncbi:hypothetical protein BUALT_Bualt17G0018700 [Buddleja alternifolia]|uniref:HORMA domain-containing protein n=1 Tax=Buddleja alternifolia TaxID=168488 RepID=A0AAV6WBR7_9LAMI|nr:hypothetical protein BUALT_Bualt17G0018700 [Buddleja alternifolia]